MAVITYETPDGITEAEIPASEISYIEETRHWKIKTGQKDGRDIYELIPRERVFSVKILGNKTGTAVTKTQN
jgi:hypothetical protein